LPYGSGVAFWALGEIVKAQAGILESDDADATANKLDESLATLISDETQRHWVGEHLRPLVGIAARDVGQTDRGEAFAAWRRYVEGLAESRTTVLVFEDLHWADDGLLDFVDNLAEWVTDVPLLLVGTARPELLSRRSNWGGGKTNALTLSLSPLSDDDTSALLHALFERSVLPAETQHRLIEQAGGNPLYAEEFVRLAQQRTGSEPAMPESVQAIIAARIDGLPSEDKRLLQQAAVIGKVFWLGGLAALSADDRWKVEEALHRLDRRDFVRRERRSSMAAETEFAFRHALVREAAYEQLPRGERAELHRRAATWIESLGRTQDVAEMLAHHYLSAIEYARAVGRPIDDFAVAAMSALRAAGDRAQALHSNSAAVRFYEAALSLMAPDDPDRAATVFAYGRALQAIGDERAVAALEQASEALAAHGERGLAAEAERLLADIGWHAGDRAATDRHIARAQELVAGLGTTPARAAVLSEVSRYHMVAHRLPEAIEVGEQAIALSRELHLPVIEAHALNNVGTARFMGGDLAGLAELELSLQLAQSANSPEASRALNNLSVGYWVIGDLERSVNLRIQSAEQDRRFDRAVLARFAEAYVISSNYFRGRWDTFIEEFTRFKAGQQSASRYAEMPINADVARILVARGRDDEAMALASACADWGRQMKEGQAITPTLGGLADVQLTMGLEAESLQTTEELASAIGTTEYLFLLIPLAAAAKSAAMIDVLRSMIPEKHVESRWLTAYLALLDSRHAEAADTLDNMGSVPHAALARTEAAERLVRAGRTAEADVLLGQALPFWRSVRAERFIRRAEALLSKTA
jgi:tetratricopeptide (TPR) repeat protein